jgi:hypothetical protein
MLDDDLYRIQKIPWNILKKLYSEKVGNQIEHILSELNGLPVRKLSLSDKTAFLLKYALKFAIKTIPVPVGPQKRSA